MSGEDSFQTFQALTGAGGVSVAVFFAWRVLRFLSSLSDMFEKATKIGRKLTQVMDAQLDHLQKEDAHRKKLEVYFERLQNGVPVHIQPDHTPVTAMRIPPHAQHSESSHP